MNRIGLFAAAAATLLFGACGGGEDAEKEFVPTALAVQADSELSELKVGATAQLKVIGSRDGEEREMQKGVVYTSSNEEVATIDGSGLVRIVAGGPVTLTAAYKDVKAEVEMRPTCYYPSSSPGFGLNRVMPQLSWANAFTRDGEQFAFDFGDLYCDAEWKNTETLVLVLSAGWCGPCTEYARMLSTETINGKDNPDYYLRLEELGMKVAIIEVDNDRQGSPADSEYAFDHLTKITRGNVPAIALGDGETEPKNFVRNSPFLEYFPTVVVMRTRDMRIIADGKRWQSYLPLAKIAADPNGDWSAAGANRFVSNCEAGDEESEDNGTPEGALAIAPGTHSGGICEDRADFYSIDSKGAWTLDLAFDSHMGNLDLVVWDDARNEPLVVDGKVVASTGKGNFESISFKGPATVAVVPYKRASATYELKLTEH